MRELSFEPTKRLLVKAQNVTEQLAPTVFHIPEFSAEPKPIGIRNNNLVRSDVFILPRSIHNWKSSSRRTTAAAKIAYGTVGWAIFCITNNLSKNLMDDTAHDNAGTVLVHDIGTRRWYEVTEHRQVTAGSLSWIY